MVGDLLTSSFTPLYTISSKVNDMKAFSTFPPLTDAFFFSSFFIHLFDNIQEGTKELTVSTQTFIYAIYIFSYQRNRLILIHSLTPHPHFRALNTLYHLCFFYSHPLPILSFSVPTQIIFYEPEELGLGAGNAQVAFLFGSLPVISYLSSFTLFPPNLRTQAGSV